ncbi:MAG: translation initiation factor IF-2 [bacterium]
MGKKRRVFHIARELNISNEAVIDFLCTMDKKVTTQMSAVSEELYDTICKKYQVEAIATDTGSDFRQKLREKKMLEELRRNKARMELEERIRFATKLAEERPQKVKGKKEEELKDKSAKKAKELKAKDSEKVVDVPARETEALQKEKRAETEEKPSVVDIISQAKKEIDKQRKAEAEHDKKSEKVKKKKEAVPEKIIEKIGTAEVIVETVGQAEVDEKKEEVVAEEGDKVDESKLEKATEDKPEKTPAETAAKATKAAKKKGKKKKKRKISEKEITESIRQTLAAMDETKPKRRRRKTKTDGEEEVENGVDPVIKVSEFISAAELADVLNVEPNEVIKKCLELGMLVSINQRLEVDSIIAVADEFGYEVEIEQEYGTELIDQFDDENNDGEEEDVEPRPPVVTIMGHVDHGKTSLLDYIRKSNIIAGEAGGITQHIGAYEVSVNGHQITFLDTPGHEAFTAMRARGAQVTDIVVLIVAADDGVQPQTVEAINHATAAGVPIVVAINKIDKPTANPDMIKKQLSEHNILIESWGGKYQCTELSAKSGEGVDKLLDLILLEADVLELKANPKRSARGIIIESKLDKGKGPVATVLVQHGTLKIGDLFVSGQYSGKVRAMYDERKKRVKEAPPSAPIQVVGFEGVPQAGDTFVVGQSERKVRAISTKRQQLKREQDFRRKRHITLDEISKQIQSGGVKELNLIIKADVDGSIEALSDGLMKLSTDEVTVNVIHKAVGGISESDVLLASVSQAIIIGFHIRPSLKARDLSQKENVDIRLYNVIYDAVEDVRSALEGLLDPEISEELIGSVEVRETFKVPKIGTIAGSYVLSGKIARNDLTKVFRDDKLINESKIASLRRFKEDVRDVASGFECGISLEGFDDIKVGDIIETYKKVSTARKLS